MKRYFFLFILLIVGISGLAADGFRVIYSVKVNSGSTFGYREVTTVCGNLMRIEVSPDTYLIFNRKAGKAWKVNPKGRTAILYSFHDNQPFYQQFLMPYGLMDDNGQLIFPGVIFKRTGNRKVVGGIACFEAKLPGEFMNSTTTVWLPEKAEGDEGQRFSQYMSFFTGDDDFLDQIRHTNGFPRLIVSSLRLTGALTVNRRFLVSIEKCTCKPEFFRIPNGIKVRKAVPNGIPLRSF